jgi:hypothetical protein
MNEPVKRGPGRPPKNPVETESNAPAAEAGSQSPRRRMTGMRAQREAKERRQRSAMDESRLTRLEVPADAKDREFEYRWVNDETAGRIQNMMSRDWVNVTGDDLEEAVEANRGTPYFGDKDTDMGANVSRIVGQNPDGSPKRAFLMAKKKEFYEEDQRRKEADLDEIDQQIKRGPVQDAAGLSQSEGGYVPGGRNTVTHGSKSPIA